MRRRLLSVSFLFVASACVATPEINAVSQPRISVVNETELCAAATTALPFLVEATRLPASPGVFSGGKLPGPDIDVKTSVAISARGVACKGKPLRPDGYRIQVYSVRFDQEGGYVLVSADWPPAFDGDSLDSLHCALKRLEHGYEKVECVRQQDGWS